MWALSPETEGCSCGLGNKVADVLCSNPHLRCYAPPELARLLGIPVNEAQEAIVRVARYAGAGLKVPLGVSLDEALANVGHSARPSENAFDAPDASGFGEDKVGNFG